MLVASKNYTPPDGTQSPSIMIYGLTTGDLTRMRYNGEPQVIDYAKFGLVGQYGIILFGDVATSVIEDTIKTHLPYAICPLIFPLDDAKWLQLYSYNAFVIPEPDLLDIRKHCFVGRCTDQDLLDCINDANQDFQVIY